MRFLPALAMLLLLGSTARPATAAESYDNCTFFIESLPAVLTTQGTWCMNRDLSSSLASGSAIVVAANNVTIDCNHFKLGGLQAGAGTQAYGIATERLNLTVRNCAIRGFRRGINAGGAGVGGHLIESNRFEANRETAINLSGTGNIVRGNLIVDTGAASDNASAYGIYFVGDGVVIDNTIDGVWPAEGLHLGTTGIALVFSNAAVARQNRVFNVDAGTASAHGISVYFGTFATVTDNDIVRGTAGLDSIALYCGSDAIVTDNRVYGYESGLSGCDDDGGNLVKN